MLIVHKTDDKDGDDDDDNDGWVTAVVLLLSSLPFSTHHIVNRHHVTFTHTDLFFQELTLTKPD